MKGSKIYLLLGVVSGYASSLLYPWLWNGAYYHLIELSILFYLLALKTKKSYSIGWEAINNFALLSILSVIFDEVFYDATKLEINDSITILVITIVTWRLYSKSRKRLNSMVLK